MTDKVTREEAKEVIQRIRNCVGEFMPTSFIHFPIYKNTIPALDMAIKSLEQDRPIGHWIWITEDQYECSECHEVIIVKEVMNVPQYITCPMCDAQMDITHRTW